MYDQTYKRIDDNLWKDSGCRGELDYVEQSSWIPFLKYLDDLEKSRESAAEHLASFIAGHEIVMKVSDTDRHGRMADTVFADGRDINLEMLKAGFAWHYKHYDKNPAYAAAEAEARASKRGLWSDPHPINPYDFRKAKRERKGR